MADITVVHPSLNRGGAEKVCLAIIEALASAGYNVRLATIDRTIWKMLEERIGKIVRPDKEVYLISSTFTFSLDMLSQAAVYALFPFILLLLKCGREEVLINTYGDLVDYLADLAYVNAIPVRLSHKVCSGFPNSFTWRAACHMYNVISSFGSFFRSPLISTPSLFRGFC